MQRQWNSHALAIKVNIQVIRRIAERGLHAAQRQENSEMVDCWQHMLDEIEHFTLYNNSEIITAFRKFAVKVKDPKYKFENEPEVLAAIAIEIAEELEVEAILDDIE